MIRGYSDHAANERTFLAWVRTGIAVIAFGFVIEKFTKISQETLADMIGTTRSRVSFFMNKFRKLGLIDYNGCIDVHSSLLSVVLHDEPHINT